MKSYPHFFVIVFCLILTAPVWAEEQATKEECVAMCEKAVKMAQEKGVDEMLRQIGDPNGPFIWKDSYIYAINITNNKVVQHPIKPALNGKDLSGLKDINGKMFFVEVINIAKDKGSGWVDYMWPKPGEKQPVKKIAYVLRVPGEPYAISAGIYE